MKSAVKVIKSLHADSQTLTAMFFGYFVLLAVTASLILGGDKTGDEHMASSNAEVQQVQTR